jgi:3-deoxy-D-manno-octulosonic-acid transferase
VVAGSTWAADETVVLPAMSTVRNSIPQLRVVIAPHEPKPDVVASLLLRFRDDGWSVATLTEIEATETALGIDVVVVDRVGVLAQLYSVGSVSYVGGGFHDAGLHSVLEPAAAGIPVVFGPRHRNARAAGDLVQVSGAKIASNRSELATELIQWLQNPEDRERAGARAFSYIEGHRGAAARTAQILDALIRSSKS